MSAAAVAMPQQQPPQQDPKANLAKYGPKLLELVQKTRTSWEHKRRGIILKVLKNKEMLKGNHNLGFYPGSYDTFDALQEYYNFTGANQNAADGDTSIDRRPHNFYQMLEKAFVAALSAQIPKNRHLPANANVQEDRETATAASRIEEIIERANKVKSMLKQELMELFTSGCYFKYTRYVVDPDRTGTHKETIYEQGKSDILPARFICFNCGVSSPENELVSQKKLACPNCGSPLSQENFFEDHIDDSTTAKQADVPNGMVLWSVYGPMHVDADPDASDLLNTGLLDISQEVSLGWLRTTFKEFWGQFEAGQSSGAGSELLERQYRNMLTSPAGTSSAYSFTAQKPTYSRTWVQPMLYAELETREMAEALAKEYPKGLMIAHVGELALDIREAKLTDEWTHCASEEKGFGLFPPPVGDPAVPVQERINDCINKIDEYFDRLACGILLANEKYIDTKAMNNKAMLPGILNGIALKAGAPVTDINQLIYQVKGEIDSMIFNYVSMLKQDMELLVSTPPQTFGAGTQAGVETMGGQQQQLSTGMMKLGLNWDAIREEHADAAENAIGCAAENMTEDWLNVVTDETKEFRNEYVHLDEMKGSVQTIPETDQGFPMTWSEIRDFYMELFEKGGEVLDYLMQEPENIDNALRYIAIPGLIAPGAGMRSKMLRVIDQLLKSQPITLPQADPATGQPVVIPSVQPNKYLDDLKASQKLIENWAQANWDKLENNQPAIDNLVAYYKMCVVYEKELAAEMQLAGGMPPAGGPPNQPQPAMA